MEPRIVIAGCGHIGSYVEWMLSSEGRYDVRSYDALTGHDFTNPDTVRLALVGATVVIDTLPYQMNPLVAQTAAELGVAYFNLSEDVKNTEFIRSLSSTAPLVPQCGLAPGMVSILAQHLTTKFKAVDTVQIRVGALPEQSFNRLGYAMTWSAAGLINEYCNPCTVVQDGRLTTVTPLDGSELLTIDGCTLEAAHTSGGIGTLAETWAGRAREVNYKTLRFPGHFDFMRVMRDDLQLSANKQIAEDWFTRTIPRTTRDAVYIAIRVTGVNNGTQRRYERSEETYTKIIRSTPMHTAIQRTTGLGVLAVVHTYLESLTNPQLWPFPTAGYVKQEDLPWSVVQNSPYASVYYQE